uniref:G-protein coupled receptors family 1 profile domain-containing protein n=2 Tax=Bos taurus TaxID=9913 RepID=A0A3Q1MPS6_BOVIN
MLGLVHQGYVLYHVQRMRITWLDSITDSMDMSLRPPGDTEGQGSLACCSPWGRQELDATERLNSSHHQHRGFCRLPAVTSAGSSSRRERGCGCGGGGCGAERSPRLLARGVGLPVPDERGGEAEGLAAAAALVGLLAGVHDVVLDQMERSLELGNMTRVQEFILLGLSTSPETREVLFAIFLTLYLLTLLENALIVFLVCSHTELHKPMYFFLGNLSCLEMCYVSVTMPSLLAGLWMGPYHVPFTACMTQLFFFIVLICTECTLLASMACDRYVAICRPLHYPLLMRPQVCLGLAGTSWLGGLLVSVAKTACIASLSYCGPNVLNHFFCDVSPLLNLSCTHVALTELVDFLSAIVIFCGTLLVSLASYSAIGVTVLRMPSAAARHKAFSTCASHLVVVGIFYLAALFIYCRPSRIRSMDLNKLLSVVYTVATPMCNPVIYCLRNREVHAALLRTLRWT